MLSGTIEDKSWTDWATLSTARVLVLGGIGAVEFLLRDIVLFFALGTKPRLEGEFGVSVGISGTTIETGRGAWGRSGERARGDGDV